MEHRAGTVEGHRTPLMARQASRAVAYVTPRDGKAMLRELGNMAPCKNSLDRLPNESSLGWEEIRERFETHFRQGSVIPDRDHSIPRQDVVYAPWASDRHTRAQH